MKKRLLFALCLLMALVPLPALAEAGQGTADGAEVPAFEPPALVDPAARYSEPFPDDGSDTALFQKMADENNDVADIVEFGAVRYTQCTDIDDTGAPGRQTWHVIQDSPWGVMMIDRVTELGGATMYSTEKTSVMDAERRDEPAIMPGFYEDGEFADYVDTFRFPYYYPESFVGTRQDENGYTYTLTKVDDETSVEYVTGADGRVVQTRVYDVDGEGALRLSERLDYEVGPAEPLPEGVQALFEQAAAELTATPETTATPEPDTDGFNIQMSNTTPVEGEYELREQYKLNSDVEGEPDAPALEHPEERYTTFFKQTDGSEMVMFMALATMNDTEFDVKKYGAVRGAAHRVLDDAGQPVETIITTFQRSPYGLMMIQEYPDSDFGTVYIVKGHVVLDDAEGVHEADPIPDEAFDMSVDGFRFSSVNLPQMMNGTRQDEAGHTYIFETEPDGRGVESVVGPELNIIQLREYERDSDGVWRLDSYSDYEVGPAIEIPQPVLDKFAEIAEPVEWPEDDGIDVDATMEDRLMAMYQQQIDAQGGVENGPLHVKPLGGSDEAEGDFDEPALVNPESRYEDYSEDGEDGEGHFDMLDYVNDEMADVERYGALYIDQAMPLNEDGSPVVVSHITIQQCPYGLMMTTTLDYDGTHVEQFHCGGKGFMLMDGELSEITGHSAEDFDFYTHSFHFPYGRLEALQGVRHDDNGYTYYLVKSDDDTSYEFVAGTQMRIAQLRGYKRDENGDLRLFTWADYDVGPAVEVPQVVLDAFGETLEPVNQTGEEPAEDTQNP